DVWLPYPSFGLSRSQTSNEMLKLVGLPDDDTARVTTSLEPERVACGTADWSAEAIAVCVSCVEASPRELSKTSRARLVSACRSRFIEMVWSAVTSSWSREPSPTTSTSAATRTSTIVKPPCSEMRGRDRCARAPTRAPAGLTRTGIRASSAATAETRNFTGRFRRGDGRILARAARRARGCRRTARRLVPERRRMAAAARRVARRARLALSRLHAPGAALRQRAGALVARAARSLPRLPDADLRPLSARGGADGGARSRRRARERRP